jgi:hypothetical protein
MVGRQEEEEEVAPEPEPMGVEDFAEDLDKPLDDDGLPELDDSADEVVEAEESPLFTGAESPRTWRVTLRGRW